MHVTFDPRSTKPPRRSCAGLIMTSLAQASVSIGIGRHRRVPYSRNLTRPELEALAAQLRKEYSWIVVAPE